MNDSHMQTLVRSHRRRRFPKVDAEIIVQALQAHPDPRDGYPADIVQIVLALRSPDSWHFDALVRDFAFVPSPFSWPDPRPVLPGTSGVDLSPADVAEQERDAQLADELDRLDAAPEQLEAEGLAEADLFRHRQARRRRRAQALSADLLAYYRSFTVLDEVETARGFYGGEETWGVHLLTGGIEALAQDVLLPVGLDVEASLRCAAAMLIGHELGHFHVDAALATADLNDPADEVPSSRMRAAEHRAMHGDRACKLAEALCEGSALAALERFLAQSEHIVPEHLRSVALDAAREHVAAGLPGYRDGATIASTQLFEALVGVLEHCGLERHQAQSAALAADLTRQTLRPADVPVRLLVSPGSAFGSGWGSPAFHLP